MTFGAVGRRHGARPGHGARRRPPATRRSTSPGRTRRRRSTRCRSSARPARLPASPTDGTTVYTGTGTLVRRHRARRTAPPTTTPSGCSARGADSSTGDPRERDPGAAAARPGDGAAGDRRRPAGRPHLDEPAPRSTRSSSCARPAPTRPTRPTARRSSAARHLLRRHRPHERGRPTTTRSGRSAAGELSAPARIGAVPTPAIAALHAPAGRRLRPHRHPASTSARSSTSPRTRCCSSSAAPTRAGSTASNQIGIWDDDDRRAARVRHGRAAAARPRRWRRPLAAERGQAVRDRDQGGGRQPVEQTRAPSPACRASWSSTTARTTSSSTFSFPGLHDNQSAPVQLAEDWTMTFGAARHAAAVAPDPVTGLHGDARRHEVDLSWTNPTRRSTRCNIVRKAGSAPAEPERRHARLPRAARLVSDTGLTNGTHYYYGVWAQLGPSARRARARERDADRAAPDPVTSLQATPGDARVDLSWTNPTSPFDQVQVVRKAGSAPANPTDGTTVFTGTGTSVADTAVTNGTRLLVRRLGRARRPASPRRRASPATPSAAPVDPVTNLQAMPGDAQVSSAWTNPATAFDTVKVVRKAGSRAGESGRRHDASSTAPGTSKLDTGLTNGTTLRLRRLGRRGTAGSPPGARHGHAGRSCARPGHRSRRRRRRRQGRSLLDEPDDPVRPDRGRAARRARLRPTRPTGTDVYTGTGTLCRRHRLDERDALLLRRLGRPRRTRCSTRLACERRPAAARAARRPTATQPAGDYGRTDTGYNLGTVFHVTQDKALLKLGRAYKAGSTRRRTRSASATATTGRSCRVDRRARGARPRTLATPLVLTAGKRYVIGIKEAAGSPWSGARALTGLPAFLVIDDTAYNVSATFGYPDLRDNQSAPIRVADDWTMAFGRRRRRLAAAPDPVTDLQATAGRRAGRPRVDEPDDARSTGCRSSARRAPPDRPDRRHARLHRHGRRRRHRAHQRHQLPLRRLGRRAAGVYSAAGRVSATPRGCAAGPVTNVVATRATRRSTSPGRTRRRRSTPIKVVRKLGADAGQPGRRDARLHRHRQTVTDSGLTNGRSTTTASGSRAAASLGGRPRQRVPVASAARPGHEPPGHAGGSAGCDLSWTNPTTAVRPGQGRAQGRLRPGDPDRRHPRLHAAPAPASPTPGADERHRLPLRGLGAALRPALGRSTRVNASPVAPPLLGVTALSATAGNARVDLAWTNPTGRFDQIVVVRKAGSDPADQTDGVQVYSGNR